MDHLMNLVPYLFDIISGILLASCVYTVNKFRGEREKERKDIDEKSKALNDGVESLLRQSIVNSYNKYHDRGYCPIYAKDSIKKAYKAYHTLGGNDVATELYKKILLMPEEPPAEGQDE